MDYYNFSEDSYLMNLRKYINKNPSYTEFDYLTNEIKMHQSIVTEAEEYNKNLEGISDEQHRKNIDGGILPNYKNIEDWKVFELEKRKMKRGCSREKRIIQDLEIRLNRIPKEDLKLNNKIQQIGNDIFPFRNKETLISFTTYTQLFIIDNYIDYSYLFQRLKKDNLIEFITHNNFFNWLKKKDFISDNTLNEFIRKESFRSLSKSFSASRDNNFNNTF